MPATVPVLLRELVDDVLSVMQMPEPAAHGPWFFCRFYSGSTVKIFSSVTIFLLAFQWDGGRKLPCSLLLHDIAKCVDSKLSRYLSYRTLRIASNSSANLPNILEVIGRPLPGRFTIPLVYSFYRIVDQRRLVRMLPRSPPFVLANAAIKINEEYCKLAWRTRKTNR